MPRLKVRHVVGVALCIAGFGYLMLSSQVEATREFNYGLNAYEDVKFEAAVRYFRRSIELSPSPAAVYNLAVASCAAVQEAREQAEDGGTGEASQKEVEQAIQTAREAIVAALGNEALREEQILDLTYLDGRLLYAEGKTEEAKARLREALALQRTFTPALRELVRIETIENPDPARELLVAIAEDKEPKLITKYWFR